ncbi:15770_t:CDS:2 [Acaulospora morrowiae]|uniref:15770_t:CDS:1 n=1 Tax=Acaulospora morrowiae TaxID=94023 RepID=A0A9N9EXP7_9GLOM|nr:15770_t:CDS:2 [Acaulospora morrowiae]
MALTPLDREIITIRQEVENVRSQNASLREQLDRAHKENITLADDNNFLRKKNSSLQQEITSDRNEYIRIETEFFNQGQEVERLKKENIGFLKNKREAERKLREETQAFENDKILWQERESELNDRIKALQMTVNALDQQNEQAAQKKTGQFNSDDVICFLRFSLFPETPTYASRTCFILVLCIDEGVTSAPETNGSHYSAIREVKNAQRTIKELERRLNELTTEIDNAKQATTESMNLNKSHARRIHSLETELSQVKHMNQSLMEENEAYRLLLGEKTMKGEFVLNSIMQKNNEKSEKKLPDSPIKVTTRTNKGDGSLLDIDISSIVKRKSLSNDLAAELNRASTLRETLLGERVYKESDHTVIEISSVQYSELLEEIRSLKDANKSMTLYIQKILNRIMEAKGFEELLSTEWSARSICSSPTSPTTGQFPFSENANTKKMGRRKTVSGATPFTGHFRSNSQPASNFTPPSNKIISEEPETPGDKKDGEGDGDKTSLSVDPLKKPAQRRASVSTSRKRLSSLFSWGTREEKKEEDPNIKPLLLVQENQIAD